jgi:hypothetical protein
VVALGASLLFVVVSVAEALTTLRAERSARGRRSRLADEDQCVSVPRNRTEDAADIDLENWPELSPDSGPDGGIIDLFPDPDRDLLKGLRRSTNRTRRNSERRARE